MMCFNRKSGEIIGIRHTAKASVGSTRPLTYLRYKGAQMATAYCKPTDSIWQVNFEAVSHE